MDLGGTAGREGAGVLVLGDEDGDHVRLSAGAPTAGPVAGDAWIEVRVEVAAGVFRADARGAVLASELRAFRDGLAALPGDPRGRAALETEDGWLAIRLFGDGFDHVDARCELRDPDAVVHRLEFTIGLDVRDLGATLAQLEVLVAGAGR